jgi:hypothetical protein
MMTFTTWKPLLDKRTLPERQLSAVVRAALPKQADAGLPLWKVGGHRVQYDAPLTKRSNDVVLRSIEWNFQERCIHSGRRVGFWRFNGIADF